MTDFLTRRGLVLRTDLLGVWDGVADAGVRAQALPDLVLRGPAARGPAHPGRLLGVLRGDLAPGPGRRRPGRRRRGADAAADLPHLPRGRHASTVPSRSWRRRIATVDMFTPGGRAARRGLDPLDARPAAATGGAATPAMSDAWRGRHVRRAGAVPARAQPRPDDPRRHQHLAAARARRRRGRSWSTRGRSRTATSTGVDEETGDVALVLLTHHHFDHSETAVDLGDPQGLPGARARPGVLPPGRPARRRRGDRRRRAVAAGAHHPRAHRRLGLARAARRATRCCPATWCWAAARRWSPTPTASSAPTSTRSSKMRAVAAAGEVAAIWPAHGPVLDDALGTLDHYLVHRRQRLAQVESALRAARHRRPGPRRRGAAAAGRRDRLPGRRRVPLGRRRVVGPRPARLPRRALIRDLSSPSPEL